MSLQKKPVRLIAAACNDLGIGKNGKLPWSLPNEFKYYLNNLSRVSRPGMFNLVVWGRLNWFSQEEFLKENVIHVVLSKTLGVVPDNAQYLREDLEGAIRLAASPPLSDIIETIWVVGGTGVYKESLMHPWCDLIYLTDVMANIDCDVFFPNFDRQIFKKQDRFPGVPSEIQEENGVKYKYEVYKKDIHHQDKLM
ncbi:dihydrofolate reductase isoform X1 [Gadus morhua]|uniref:dihydrofolate reductase n=1 Tax=Gadus morhua TaxID=8049 RepID=A0A8C4ZT21_GADMO|nr:dihydrofolate reductase-like isoform X1 [Gadus morhua]